MSDQIKTILKNKLEGSANYEGLDAETRINTLKEELQYYVLNFIYHQSKYNNWIMYGGSALRIIHGLDRMSVDLDFEIPDKVTNEFLNNFKKEIKKYFLNTYNAGDDFLSIKINTGRGLLLRFHVGEELSSGYSSNQIHVKIDLHNFVAPKAVTERWPISHGQLSFIIITYNMGNLMASKLAAIFLRESRGVGKAIYGEKGRDIYDLLWYMDKKIIPDFDYLIAKGVKINDPYELFNKLTIKMNEVDDKNLEQDLKPLFINKFSIEDWLKNWRETYLRLYDNYNISRVTVLESIGIHEDFRTNNLSFIYRYKAEEGGIVRVIYNLSDYWITFREGDLSIKIDNKTIELVEDDAKKVLNDKLKQYIALFYKKTEKYFEKTNRIIIGDDIATKLIRMTTDNLNQKEQIVLNKSALVSSELDDLLK